MQFYALQITCTVCGRIALVGGSARNDLSKWRDSRTVCPSCGAELHTNEGKIVSLAAAAQGRGAGRSREASPRP